MNLNEHISKMNEIVNQPIEDTEEAKQNRNNAFWDAAIDAFNDLIAGDVTLVDGRTIHTPKFKRV